MQLEVTAKSQDGEAATGLYERLLKEAPAPIKFTGRALATMSAERDKSGFAELQSLAG